MHNFAFSLSDTFEIILTDKLLTLVLCERTKIVDFKCCMLHNATK